MELKCQQKEALRRIQSFIRDKETNIFVLNGYAGTGKTTLLKVLVQEAKRLGKYPIIMAPTGRATKMLREKTGHQASTIHSAIYAQKLMLVQRHDDDGNLINVRTWRDQPKKTKGSDQIEFFFDIKGLSTYINELGINTSPDHTVIIIDESSLISSKESQGEMLHFGTGILLDDLLTFASPLNGAKIIFVGDPAQLSPVGDSNSMALFPSFFEGRGLKTDSFELTEVIRQEESSMVLHNALKARDLLSESLRNSLQFDSKADEWENIEAASAIHRFIETQAIPDFGKEIVVCYSNAQVKEYNDQIRSHYFSNINSVQEGDILQIVQNSFYYAPEGHLSADDDTNQSRELFNGDFIKVLKVSPESETLTSFIWNNDGDKGQRISYPLTFRDIEFLTEDGRHFSRKILESLLDSDKANTSAKDQIALYMLLRMRHPEIMKDEEAMSVALRSDPYYNALHVKYGYAVTAHKAQGGEWDTVYVDFTYRKGLSTDHIRWMYTAITRASKRLYAINAPHITPFSKFSISEICRISKAPKGIISIPEIKAETKLSSGAQPFRKMKYLSLEKKLADQDCSITHVVENQYLDTYHIATPEGEVIMDCWYNDAGYFSRYKSKSGNQYFSDLIISMLDDESDCVYEYSYAPTFDALKALKEKIESACDELGIKISDIREFKDQYYVRYALKTSGKFSFILFYFKANGAITRAMPSSDLGKDDTLLQALIDKIK